MTLLLSILNYVTDSWKQTVTAIVSGVTGFAAPIPTIQIIGGWVATISGLLAIINYFFPLRSFYDEYKEKHKKYIRKHERQDI